jgi:fatty acid desaturase
MMDDARRMRAIFSRDEIAWLTTASDARGALSLLASYAIIATSFALCAHEPHALTIAIALFLIGGRQLGLAVLMHECAHRSLFRSRWLNDWVGRWLCAAPIWNRLEGYRRHHLPHHAHTGSERDPDLCLVTPFPTSRASLIRKFARDLFGLTGLKRVAGMLAMDAGLISYTASGNAQRIDQRGRGAGAVLASLARHTGPTLLFQAALWALLWSLGHGWLFGVWCAAWLTTFSMFVRVRSMAEHAMTDRSEDTYRNTRTTRANWLARLLVAPHDVNHHLEHHLLMTVPHYKLAAMHRMLRERGALAGCHLSSGYTEVLGRMVG